MKIKTLPAIASLLVTSLLSQPVAFAINPMAYSEQMAAQSAPLQSFMSWVEQRAQHRYEKLSTARKVTLLERSEKRIQRNIHKIEKMNESVFDHRQKRALQMINSINNAFTENNTSEENESGLSQDNLNAEELSTEVLSQDEKDLVADLQTNSNEPVRLPAPTQAQSKTQTIENLNRALEEVRAEKESLTSTQSAKEKRTPNRSIASSHGLLIGFGVLILIIGLAVVTFGLLAFFATIIFVIFMNIFITVMVVGGVVTIGGSVMLGIGARR